MRDDSPMDMAIARQMNADQRRIKELEQTELTWRRSYLAEHRRVGELALQLEGIKAKVMAFVENRMHRGFQKDLAALFEPVVENQAPTPPESSE